MYDNIDEFLSIVRDDDFARHYAMDQSDMLRRAPRPLQLQLVEEVPVGALDLQDVLDFDPDVVADHDRRELAEVKEAHDLFPAEGLGAGLVAKRHVADVDALAQGAHGLYEVPHLGEGHVVAGLVDGPEVDGVEPQWVADEHRPRA